MEPGSSPAPVAPEGRRALARALWVAFAVAGVVFMVIAFRCTWDRTGGSVLPSWSQASAAFALIVAGLVAAERGWHALVGSGDPRLLARAFFTAQLGKYIPGGVWQAVGQIGLSSRAGVPMPRAVGAFPIHAITQVAAGGGMGAILTLSATHLDGGARLAMLAGLGLAVLLLRGWMERALRLARRPVEGIIPAQRAIFASSGWSVITLIASGGAFALLAMGTDAAADAWVMIPAYALAWAAGFLALPFPAGLGVREAVLIALTGPAAPIVAVSVAHRLITIAAEAALIVATRARGSVNPGAPSS